MMEYLSDLRRTTVTKRTGRMENCSAAGAGNTKNEIFREGQSHRSGEEVLSETDDGARCLVNRTGGNE